jgi:hypothetical protein
MTGRDVGDDRRGRARLLGGVAAVAVVGAVALSGGCGGDGGGDGGDDGDDAGLTDADVEALRDDLDAHALETITRALYENPGSRADLIEGAADDDPELADEIQADGEVTYEEFATIEDVQDAAATYGGDIVTFVQDRLVEATGDDG